MSIPQDAFPVRTEVPIGRGLRWCTDGLRLWRLAPFKLFILCLVQLLIEAVLQLIPWAGVTLSKIVVPLLLFGMLLGLDGCARGQRMRWSCILDGFRQRPFVPVLGFAAFYGLSVFAVQQATAWLVYGWPAVDAVWLGHAMAHRAIMTPAFERTLLLPGILPSVLLIMAPCLFLIDGLSPWRAIAASVRTVLRLAPVFAVFFLVLLGLFMLMLATPWAFALVLLIGPWSLACAYVIWKDLRRTAATTG
jgi:hypothetical protein